MLSMKHTNSLGPIFTELKDGVLVCSYDDIVVILNKSLVCSYDDIVVILL